jgi:predicted O-methyltransferase YrrM
MTALYARLLGIVWDRLPVEIRDMHQSAGRAEGRSAVERGAGTLARLGGIVLIDNVPWGGSVANLADTQAIRALNAKFKGDGRVDLALFAVGDGMTRALKR